MLNLLHIDLVWLPLVPAQQLLSSHRLPPFPLIPIPRRVQEGEMRLVLSVQSIVVP